MLTITQTLRQHKLIAAFVEYCGPGVDALALPDRSTISNMTPEFGATMGYFPIDGETLRYLRLTGRAASEVALVEAYAKAQGLWRDAHTPVPDYSRVIDIDLDGVEPSIAGPRRPHERLALAARAAAFRAAHFRIRAGGGRRPRITLKDGDVVIAAITSCTNTSNPAVMIGAGLLARNAVARGLKPKPWVKTSLSPGSRVVADYLQRSGLLAPLETLGFSVIGFGCMTCMGNSGPLAEPIATAIERDCAAVAVLSGNRNFEGRIHPSVRANFLASPPLVVAYALAGTILKDLTTRAARRRPRRQAGLPARPLAGPRRGARDRRSRTLSPELFKSATRHCEGTPEWRAHRRRRAAPISSGRRRAPSSGGRRSSTTCRRSPRRRATSAARACSRCSATC